MATKLRKVTKVLLKDQAGVGTAQVVASTVTDAVKVYKQGATITTAVGPIGTGTAVAVRDTGRLIVGDTVQNGTNSTHTATVASIVSRTSITLTKVGASVLNFVVGDRIVVTSNRPTIYTESTGSVAAGSSNVTTDAAGKASFYATEAVVDLIYSGTGITTDSEYDVEAGYVSKVIDIRDYGGDLQAAIDALPAGEGGGIYLPDGYTCTVSSTVTINKVNTRIFSDSWGKATIIGTANPAFILIKVTQGGLVCENIRFDHNGTSTSASYDLIQLNGLDAGIQPITFRNCYFLRWRRNAMRITGGVYNLTVSECWFEGGFGEAVYCQTSSGITDPVAGSYGAATPTHIRFFNCEVAGITTSATQAAFYFVNSGPVTIDGVIFETIKGGTNAASAVAIHCDTVSWLRINRCHFEQATSGIYLAATAPDQFVLLSNSHGAAVENCSVNGSSNTSVQPYRFVLAGNSTRGTFANIRVSNLKTAIKRALDCDATAWGWFVGPHVYETGETNVIQEPYQIVNSTAFKCNVYADVTARDTAVTGAVAANGNICYLTSTHKFYGYVNGTWTSFGAMT